MRKILLLIMVLFCVSFASAATGNTVFNFKFNDDYVDSSSNAHSANWNGGSPNYQPAKLSNGVDLLDDTPQYVDFTISGANAATIRTCEGWFNISNDYSGNDCILSIDTTDGANKLEIFHEGSSSNLVALLSVNSVQQWRIDSSSTASRNTFHHFVIRFGAGGAELFLDGNSVGSDGDTNTMDSDFNDVKIGARYNGGNNVDGGLDNIICTDSKYDNTDVSNAYNGGAGRELDAGGGASTPLTPPTVSSVSISPEFPTSANNFYEGSCNGYSPDSRNGTRYYGQWFLNDVLLDVVYHNTTGCLQENMSTDITCYGNETGSISFTGSWTNSYSLYDGNWSSSANAASGTATATIIYKIPKNAINASWVVKGQSGNYSIPIPGVCFNRSDTDLQLQMTSTVASDKADFTCLKPDSTYENLYSDTGSLSIYEEAINWTVYELSGNFTDNTTVNINNLTYTPFSAGDELKYQCTAYYNGTFSAPLNASVFVISYDLDNCTNSSYAQALQFTVINDTSDANIPASIQYVFNYRENRISTYKNFSNNIGTVWNETICIYPNQSSIISDILLLYTAGGTTFEYSADDINLTSTSQSIPLYYVEDTTAVTFTVKDITDAKIPGAIIKVMKYDVGTDTYETTEILQTNSDGQAVGNIILTTTRYKFIVEYDGVQELETLPTVILTTTQTLVIDLTADDYYDNYDPFLDVVTDLSYDNSTFEFEFTFSDPGSVPREGCLVVTESNQYEKTNVVDECLTTAAGTITGDISGLDHTGKTYVARAYVTVEGNKYLAGTLEFDFGGPVGGIFDFDKGEAVKMFVTFLLCLGLVLMSISFPSVAIFMLLIGLIVSVIFNLFSVSPLILASLVITGLLFMFKQKR